MSTPCRLCSTEIPPQYVNDERRFATCPRCRAVTDLAASDTALAVRGETTLPGGYEILAAGPSSTQGFRDAASPSTPIIVRWRWRSVERSGDTLVLVFFALLWNAVTVTAMVSVLIARIWSVAAMLSVFLWAGWMLGRMAVEKALNKTTMELNADTLTVRVAPIARDRNRTLPVADIDALFCLDGTVDDGPVTFSLVARLRSGADVVLVSDLLTPEQVFCLASLFEQKMRLHDRLPSGSA